MTKTQRKTFLIMLVVSLVYFGIFIFPNAYGASTDQILVDSSSDEYTTYPYVVRMLTLGKTFFDERANLFLYEDYHYGYPFYVASALVVLPVRIIFGTAFTDHMQLNLLLLRQLINIVPMILAAGLMVFLQTRFTSTWKSLALFIFLLTIRGVVRNHIWWWHPDALTVLCMVLVLFFLDRDRLRLGKNFYLAALFCGLATAIKLLGVFFFLTIPVYLLVCILKKQATWLKAARAGMLFVVILVATVILANPFLFSKDQRVRMIMIQQQKQEELSKGYTHDDPIYYSKGPQWWITTLEKWYATPMFLVFLVFSMLAGSLWGNQRLLHLLILTWVVPYSIYVLYFVAVKPDHYWLPVVLPLYSCAFAMLDILVSRIDFWQKPFFRSYPLQKLVMLLLAAVLAGQLILNLARPVSGNIAIYQSAVQTGIAQLERKSQ